jgi:hypothetical protein
MDARHKAGHDELYFIGCFWRHSQDAVPRVMEPSIHFTSEQPPSAMGRNACSAAIVETSL